MIVVDASTAVAGLLNDGPARELLATEQLHAPHLIDLEVASVLRRQAAASLLTIAQAEAALGAWLRLGVTRHPHGELLERVWRYRHNLSAYDASYVALAEAMRCSLVTLDVRLARAPGITCPVTVLPR